MKKIKWKSYEDMLKDKEKSKKNRPKGQAKKNKYTKKQFNDCFLSYIQNILYLLYSSSSFVGS